MSSLTTLLIKHNSNLEGKVTWTNDDSVLNKLQPRVVVCNITECKVIILKYKTN